MNITKKRLLKIKKTNNQSRKKLYPKYKKYKKNKSFRRRQKHNLQNKSLKKYKKLIKKKYKKKLKKGGNKLQIKNEKGQMEIVLNQLVPNNDNDNFLLMPSKYSPISKNISFGNKEIIIEELTESIINIKNKIKEIIDGGKWEKTKKNAIKNYFNETTTKNTIDNLTYFYDTNNRSEKSALGEKLTKEIEKIKKGELKLPTIKKGNKKTAKIQQAPSPEKNDDVNKTLDETLDTIIEQIKTNLDEIISNLKEEENNIVNGKKWLKNQVTIQYNENTLPLWKWINSIALLTETDITLNGKENSINLSSFKKFRESIDKCIKEDRKNKINKHIVFYSKKKEEENYKNLEDMNYLPLLNWNNENNILTKEEEKKEALEKLMELENLMKNGENETTQQGGDGDSDKKMNRFNSFVKSVINAKKLLDKDEKATKAEDELYTKFINQAGQMKKQLEFIEYNKSIFEKKKIEIISRLQKLQNDKKDSESFDPQQQKNDLVKLFVKKRETLMKEFLNDTTIDQKVRDDISMEFQKFKNDKQKETDAIDAQLKISQGKEAATNVPKTPGSFSMGNHFNAIANDKYPNDQYIVPESLDPWGITIDPEKNGLFARFNIRQHPYQFDKDNEVINEFNLVDTPEWLQFVGDSLEDRRGITPAYKPPVKTNEGKDKKDEEKKVEKGEAEKGKDKKAQKEEKDKQDADKKGEKGEKGPKGEKVEKGEKGPNEDDEENVGEGAVSPDDLATKDDDSAATKTDSSSSATSVSDEPESKTSVGTEGKG